MSDSYAWARRFFSDDEIEDLMDKTDRLLFDNENGFVISVGITNQQCMELVEHWWNTLDPVDDYSIHESYDYIHNFMAEFMWFLETYLDEEHTGWRERRYGIEEEEEED